MKKNNCVETISHKTGRFCRFDDFPKKREISCIPIECGGFGSNRKVSILLELDTNIV